MKSHVIRCTKILVLLLVKTLSILYSFAAGLLCLSLKCCIVMMWRGTVKGFWGLDSFNSLLFLIEAHPACLIVVV